MAHMCRFHSTARLVALSRVAIVAGVAAAVPMSLVAFSMLPFAVATEVLLQHEICSHAELLSHLKELYACVVVSCEHTYLAFVVALFCCLCKGFAAASGQIPVETKVYLLSFWSGVHVGQVCGNPHARQFYVSHICVPQKLHLHSNATHHIMFCRPVQINLASNYPIWMMLRSGCLDCDCSKAYSVRLYWSY